MPASTSLHSTQSIPNMITPTPTTNNVNNSSNPYLYSNNQYYVPMTLHKSMPTATLRTSNSYNSLTIAQSQSSSNNLSNINLLASAAIVSNPIQHVNTNTNTAYNPSSNIIPRNYGSVLPSYVAHNMKTLSVAINNNDNITNECTLIQPHTINTNHLHRQLNDTQSCTDDINQKRKYDTINHIPSTQQQPYDSSTLVSQYQQLYQQRNPLFYEQMKWLVTQKSAVSTAVLSITDNMTPNTNNMTNVDNNNKLSHNIISQQNIPITATTATSSPSHPIVPALDLSVETTIQHPSKRARGQSCHQCKTRRNNSNDMYSCGNLKRKITKRVCRKQYCHNCLLKSYNELVHGTSNSNGINPQWSCPACRNICICAHCRRNKNPNTMQQNDNHSNNDPIVPIPAITVQ